MSFIDVCKSVVRNKTEDETDKRSKEIMEKVISFVEQVRNTDLVVYTGTYLYNEYLDGCKPLGESLVLVFPNNDVFTRIQTMLFLHLEEVFSDTKSLRYRCTVCASYYREVEFSEPCGKKICTIILCKEDCYLGVKERELSGRTLWSFTEEREVWSVVKKIKSSIWLKEIKLMYLAYLMLGMDLDKDNLVTIKNFYISNGFQPEVLEAYVSNSGETLRSIYEQWKSSVTLRKKMPDYKEIELRVLELLRLGQE